MRAILIYRKVEAASRHQRDEHDLPVPATVVGQGYRICGCRGDIEGDQRKTIGAPACQGKGSSGRT